MKIRTTSRPIRRALHPCHVIVMCALTGTNVNAVASDVATGATQVEFNSQFLVHNGAAVDLTRYNKGNPAVPGNYRVDLYVNSVWLGRASVTLKQVGAERNNVLPCFDRELLERVGVDLGKIDPKAEAAILTDDETPDDARADKQVGPRGCATLEQWIPDATASFDVGEQRLNVTVPQAAMNRSVRGYVDPRYWNDGVPAALLGYNANYFRSEQQGRATSQGYVGLTGGVNIGPWRLRHTGNLTTSSGTGSQYQSMQTNLQRSISSLRSQLIVGDAYTDGTLFDSFGFRGVQLATDDRMLPQSQRGYAPRVTGIARSNAVVRVKQNGNVIYETNVSPGAFVIDDLYPTGYGGDLNVEVTESDGSVRVSSVPYAAAVNALRPGVTRYSVTSGLYRDPLIDSHPYVVQATVQHGVTNLLTGYGGVLASQNYAAGMAGVALNTDWGAVGLDATQSTANLGVLGRRTGQSMRLSYSKLIAPTDTNVTVAAYRYSSHGYLDLRDAMALRYGERDAVGDRGSSLPGGLLRGRLQLTMSQQLSPKWGSFYVSGSSQDYWDRQGRDTQFQAGYNTNIGSVSTGISLSRQYDASSRRWDNVAMLNIGIPIGFGSRQLYASTSVQNDFRGRMSVQQSVTGSAGDDSALTYAVNANHSRASGDEGSSTTAGGNVAYASPYATMAANASGGQGYSQYGASLSGGAVAYRGGVAFTPVLGDTVVVIEAQNAGGARVVNGSGLRVDPWGHAIVSNLTPFASNEIELDPKGLPLSVELKSSVEHAAPTAGAVVPVKFEAEGGGRSVLVRARLPNGDPVPFGAQVTDMAGHDVGTVAQAGRLLLRGMRSDAGQYRVQWGDGSAQQCLLPVKLSPQSSESPAQEWTTVETRCDILVAHAG